MNARPYIDLNVMYDSLNQELFEGALPTIPCVFNHRLRRAMGRTHMCRKGRKKEWLPTKIDIKVGLSPEHLHKTMVHELCHVWAIHVHQSTGHSTMFWQKMATCGYPDGHTFAQGIEKDKWQLTKNSSFRHRQRVFFEDSSGTTMEGFVLRINKRTITVQTIAPRKSKWRVSPSTLRTTPER